jgi:hypothetical protein
MKIIIQLKFALFYYILNLVRVKCDNKFLDGYTFNQNKGNYFVMNNFDTERINDIIYRQDLKSLTSGVTSFKRIPNKENKNKENIFSEQQPEIITNSPKIDLNLISLGFKNAKFLSNKLNNSDDSKNSCKCSDKVSKTIFLSLF